MSTSSNAIRTRRTPLTTEPIDDIRNRWRSRVVFTRSATAVSMDVSIT